MDKAIRIIEALFASSLFWGIVALVLGAVTLSGRFSLRGADTILLVAWLIAIVGIFGGKPVANFELIPRLLITTLCMSIIGLGFYRLSLWFHTNEIGESKPTFGVEVRSSLVSDSGPLTLFMVGYPSMFGNTASPIFYLSYIQITNLQDVSRIINDFQVAVSKEREGPWEELIPIPLPSSTLYQLGVATPSPKIVKLAIGTFRLATAITKEDMKLAAVVQVSPALESEIANPIQPHETIRGWVALDSLRRVGLSPGQIYFRIKLRDAANKSGTYVAELPRRQPGDPTLNINSGEIKVVGIRTDISGFHTKYYGDPFPPSQGH